MTTHGSLSIAAKPTRWSKAAADGYLAVAAVGVLSGVVVAYARMPLHWPGHKAIFWMAPILAARLTTRTRAGATAGSLATALSALSLGGRIAGGAVWTPLIILAGLVLDLGAQLAERWKPSAWRCAILLAVAGTAANLICFVKRLFDPIGAYFSTGNLQDLFIMGGSHALFGFLAGLLGTAGGYAIIAWRHRRRAEA